MRKIRRYGTGADFKAVDVPLSNFAVAAYAEEMEGMVADRLFPLVPVGKQSDGYYILTAADWLRINDAERAPGTRANRIEWSTSTSTYFCPNYALATETPLEDFINADVALNIRENNSDFIVENLKRGREKRVANICTSISNLGSGVALSGATAWSAYSSSTPLADVSTGRAFIRSRTGLAPNTMVMDDGTFDILRFHPDLLDLYKHTQPGGLTEADIAKAFRVKNLWVADAVENTAQDDVSATLTGADVWGNNALLCYVGPATGRKTKTFGVRFGWTNPIYGTAFATKRKVEDEAGEAHIEVQEAGHYEDEVVVARDLSYGFTSTL